MDGSGSLIIILIILSFLSGVFSAVETAFSSASRIRLKNQAHDGNKKAGRVLEVLEDFDRFLTTILIGNNLVNICMATIGTVLFTRLIGERYGATVSTIVITIVVLIFGEISPKSIARKMPVRFACATVGFVQFCEAVFTPLAAALGLFQTLASKLVKVQDDESDISDELMTMVNEAEREGDLKESESDLISAAIDFRDLNVEDILTPRVSVVAVDVSTPVEEIEKKFRMNSFSRLPVFENSIDNIVGVIHQKDFYELIYHDRTQVRRIIKPIVYTSRGIRISLLLKQMQAAKIHMAVVLDEFGGTDGIVTMEDIIEELVGEIWDEHDIVKEYYQKINDTTYLVQCGAEVDDLFERFGIEDDETENHDYITVSGWVIHQFGYIPKAGEKFDFHQLRVTVTQVDQRKVIQVKLEEKSVGQESEENGK